MLSKDKPKNNYEFKKNVSLFHKLLLCSLTPFVALTLTDGQSFLILILARALQANAGTY